MIEEEIKIAEEAKDELKAAIEKNWKLRRNSVRKKIH